MKQILIVLNILYAPLILCAILYLSIFDYVFNKVSRNNLMEIRYMMILDKKSFMSMENEVSRFSSIDSNLSKDSKIKTHDIIDLYENFGWIKEEAKSHNPPILIKNHIKILVGITEDENKQSIFGLMQ